jgi:hypothetical protein
MQHDENKPARVEPRSRKHGFVLFLLTIMAWFHLVLDTQLLSWPSCFEPSCGFLQIWLKRGSGVNCEQTCVSLLTVPMRRGWTCGTCFQCFHTQEELKFAVNHTLKDAVSAKTAYADRYGWPMGKWCFTVTDLSRLFEPTPFSYDRVTLSYDIDAWNGARSFNQSICEWGRQLLGRGVAVTDVFTSTSCPNQTTPNLLHDLRVLFATIAVHSVNLPWKNRSCSYGKNLNGFRTENILFSARRGDCAQISASLAHQ